MPWATGKSRQSEPETGLELGNDGKASADLPAGEFFVHILPKLRILAVLLSRSRSNGQRDADRHRCGEEGHSCAKQVQTAQAKTRKVSL